jgi:hypothetical protein
MRNFRPPGQCPVCGEWVYRGQAACAECGACERSGWRADAAQDGLDLPDPAEDFDYDAFIEREFGSGSERRIGDGRWSRLWWWVAVALLASLGAALFWGLF